MMHAAAPDALAANAAFARITALLDASNAAYTLHEHAPSVTVASGFSGIERGRGRRNTRASLRWIRC